MKSPTTTTCQYCGDRPADQTLFTVFMRCGEGDATKHKAHLCERCRIRAMRVLDHIGMTIAFDGDGQLRWDALITLSERATRSRARRAMQREDLLLELDDPATTARARKPPLAEKLSIIHELAVEERLIESTVDRGREFWPEDTCRLTVKGQGEAAFIRNRRRAEANGLPIEEWKPGYVIEQVTEREFREYASHPLVSPDDKVYDADHHLMLRRKDEASADEEASPQKTHLFFDEELWTTQPLQPVGYFVLRNTPAIAFDADGVQMLAEYYELIRSVAGTDVRWTIMEPAPKNPMHKVEAPDSRTIRADGPGIEAAAFVSIFDPPGERPGIQALRELAHRRAEDRR
ncbi:MAG: hypothetical protein OXG72_04895 [Acidobacteria bacterium]|nr:hypothetical protein [Acidobacteriota bacterium]